MRTLVGCVVATTILALVASAGDPPPPPNPRVDPRAVYNRVQRFALAEGTTKTAIAGYLYLLIGKRKKSEQLELDYAKHGVAANLSFQKQ